MKESLSVSSSGWTFIEMHEAAGMRVNENEQSSG